MFKRCEEFGKLVPVMAWMAALLALTPAAARGNSALPVRVPRVERPPVIDGVLDDEIWQRPPVETAGWRTYFPRRGEQLPQTTTIWVAADARYLYVAFRCTDPEPGRIRTGIRRRDAISADDWVLVSIDPTGSRQAVYQMHVNPDGIQADSVVNSAGVESLAPDWVWDSEGRGTGEGYDVELRLPLSSLPFKAGSEVQIGAWFARGISRLGASMSWPEVPAGVTELERHVPLILEHAPGGPMADVMPATTYGLRQSRLESGRFGAIDDRADVGMTLKARLTGSVTLEATVNPDFSQVESDAYQVEINQRFPIYYAEKRPFFMEGAGAFELPEGPHVPILRRLVHTRRIVDPAWGAKLTGTAGPLTYAGLTAADQVPDVDDMATTYVGVGRAQHTMGPGNYAGAVVTVADGDRRSNRIAGGDLTLALDAHQRISAWVLRSSTSDTERGGAAGTAGMARYTYTTRPVFFEASVQHVDRGFEADMGMLNQTGVTRASLMYSRAVYPRSRWLRRLDAWVLAAGDRDQVAGRDGYQVETAVGFSLSRQGRVNIARTSTAEPWAGRVFRRATTSMIARSQVLPWLRVEASASRGGAVYYDPVAPFAGEATTARAGVTIQPTARFSQTLTATHSRLVRDDGTRAYDPTLVDSRTMYQFTKRFFARAVLQYDSSRQRVLTDALASYELRPGTVAHGGYGSLIERQDPAVRPDLVRHRYETTTRGLYFKVSYLLRLGAG